MYILDYCCDRFGSSPCTCLYNIYNYPTLSRVMVTNTVIIFNMVYSQDFFSLLQFPSVTRQHLYSPPAMDGALPPYLSSHVPSFMDPQDRHS